MTTLTLSKAINEGLRKALEDDPKVVVMGEDVGQLGGVFRVTDGLQKDFGESRVVDTPLGESGIVGTAVGLALRGYRPVCEIQFDGFVFPAFDQIVSQLAKMRMRSQGRAAVPVTIRIPFGGGIGAVEHHSESPEALFAHTAGLRVVACSGPADAYTMIQQSIHCDDPVIFFEPKPRYCGSAGSRPRTRRPGWRITTCRTWTGCWTPSTARSRTERPEMSEVKQFRLPDVGEGLTEADIVSWHVKPGDSVTLNQVIVEIETAKAVVELPSPYEGVVTELLAEEGSTVDVGTPIIAVDVTDEATTDGAG